MDSSELPHVLYSTFAVESMGLLLLPQYFHMCSTALLLLNPWVSHGFYMVFTLL